MNGYKEFSDDILSNRRADERREEFKKRMGDPVKFIQDADEELRAKGFGVGFWKTDDGVLVVRRYANGYKPEAAIFYDRRTIDTLKQVLDFVEPRIGTREGEVCGRDGCDGVLEYHRHESCTCHINPPCSACIGATLYCPKCGYDSIDEEGNDGV